MNPPGDSDALLNSKTTGLFCFWLLIYPQNVANSHLYHGDLQNKSERISLLPFSNPRTND